MERRWRDNLLRELIPSGQRHPGYRPQGTDDAWSLIERNAPPLTRWGLRIAVWVLTLRSRLARDPTAFLSQAEDHPSYTVRQCVSALKTLGCLVYLDPPEIYSPLDPGPSP